MAESPLVVTDEALDAATLALVEDYEPGWKNVLSSRVKDTLLAQYRSSARAALEAAVPFLQGSTKLRQELAVDPSAVAAVIREHRIECTGLGEVSCAGCRERGWMSTWDYEEHLTDAIVTAVGGVS